MLQIGKVAPNFILENVYGDKVSLVSFRGMRIILFFFPKALSINCTKEVKEFISLYERFKSMNYEIIGIGKEHYSILRKFKDKNNIPFIILSDFGFKVSKEYNVYEQKYLYGRTYMGIVRSIFIIDDDGIIRSYQKNIHHITGIWDCLEIAERIDF